MAKSMRSKREKRLRAIRRELVEPIYDKKEAAKLAVQDAALAAPKLPVKPTRTVESAAMDIITAADASFANQNGLGMVLSLSFHFSYFFFALVLGSWLVDFNCCWFIEFVILSAFRYYSFWIRFSSKPGLVAFGWKDLDLRDDLWNGFEITPILQNN